MRSIRQIMEIKFGQFLNICEISSPLTFTIGKSVPPLLRVDRVIHAGSTPVQVAFHRIHQHLPFFHAPRCLQRFIRHEMVNPTTSLAALQTTNGTSTPNGILKSNAESPATPASTSVAPSAKPEKAAKPAPRLSIEATAEQLSAALGDKWEDYGRELNLFIGGKRTRSELQETLDQVLTDALLKRLHNNLLMGILANASRDPPPVNSSFSGWNRNKKRKEPMTGRGKSSGKQKRLKTEIMGLGPQERNRIKSFKAINELDPVSQVSIVTNMSRVRKNYILLFLEPFSNRDGQSPLHDYRKTRISSQPLRHNWKRSRGTTCPWRPKHWNYLRWTIY